jgi:CrcB protein
MDRYHALVPLWVALGSAIGGAGRYWISGLVARFVGETFPWGTLAVNVAGSFVIGLIYAATGPDARLIVGAAPRHFMMTGILGGFTTFSSFSLQTLTLMQTGEWWAATANVLLSVILCLVAAWLGIAVGGLINR